MKQVAQRLRDGRVEVLDVPRLEIVKKGFLGKARSRPDDADELSPLDTMQVTLAALESGLTGRAISPSAGPFEA